jgi:hypothetical protein
MMFWRFMPVTPRLASGTSYIGDATACCREIRRRIRRKQGWPRSCERPESRKAARFGALGVDVAVDQLDHRQRGVVAMAEAGLEDAGVAAAAVLVARPSVSNSFTDIVFLELRSRSAEATGVRSPFLPA